MATFSYRAYDMGGLERLGEIDASSLTHATELLHSRGLLVYKAAEIAGAAQRPATGQSRKAKLSLKDFAGFARQLATLLQAELPLDQCLRLVASQGQKTRVGPFADRLAASVIAGYSLSATIEKEAPEAPAFIAPLIKAGEARGTLTPCLLDLARILERRVEVQNRLRGALVYPCLLLVVALIAVAIVMAVLVPTLMPLFQDSGTSAPIVLVLADATRTFLVEQWPLVLAGGTMGVFVLSWLARRPAVRLLRDEALLRIPGLGLLAQRTNTALLARTLGTLLRNGVPLVQALALSTTVATNARFKRALEAATEAVREGQRLAHALKRSNVFSDLALRFVAIGEEASKLDDMLLHLADVTDEESQRQLEGLLTLVTPLITLVIGAMVGGLILSVMQAVLSVNDIALQ